MSTISAQFTLDGTQFVRSMKSSLDKAKQSIRSFEGDVKGANFAANLGKSVMGGLGLGAGIGALQAIEKLIAGTIAKMNQLADSAVNLRGVSQATGLSPRFIQSFRQANAEMGLTAEAADAAMQKFSKLYGDAIAGDAGASETLRRAGISVRDEVTGAIRDQADAYDMLAESLRAARTEAERTSILTRIFGDQGARMAPVFAGGAEGFGRRIDSVSVASDADLEALEDWDSLKTRIRHETDVLFSQVFGLVRRAISNSGEKQLEVFTRLLPSTEAQIAAITDRVLKEEREAFEKRREAAKEWADQVSAAKDGTAITIKDRVDASNETPAAQFRRLVDEFRAKQNEIASVGNGADAIAKIEKLGKEADALAGKILSLGDSMESARDQVEKARQDAEDRAQDARIAGEEAVIMELREAAKSARELADLEKEIAEKREAAKDPDAGVDLVSVREGQTAEEIDAAVAKNNLERARRRKDAAEALEKLEQQKADLLQAQEDKKRREAQAEEKVTRYGKRLDSVVYDLQWGKDAAQAQIDVKERDQLIDKIQSLDPSGKFYRISDTARTVGDSLAAQATAGLSSKHLEAILSQAADTKAIKDALTAQN